MRDVFLFASALLLALATQLGAQERIAVRTEPGTPVIAIEFLLTIGPIDEESGRGGLAHLSARTAIAPLESTLDSLGAHIALAPEKDALSISVIAAPEVWEEAVCQTVIALFRESPDSLTMIRQRQETAAELRGRQSNPADAATLEMDRAFYGADHPWGRPTIGTPESVQRLTFREVDEFLRAQFTPDRAFVSVVGPVEAQAALDHIRPLLGTAFPSPVEVIPFRPEASPLKRSYNSITTWISATYRLPETADLEALRFLAFLATERLSFSPSQRSVYNVWSDFVPRVGGGEMRLQVVIPPEEEDVWTERLETIVTRITTEPMIDDVFESLLRRYHGERAMQLLAPEQRAHAMARELLVEGDADDLLPRTGGLTQERIREAARSLASPTIVLLGPTLDD